MHDDDHDDDVPVGRVLSRREMLALLGGWATLAACAPTALRSGTATPTADSLAAAPATATAAASATAQPSATPTAVPSATVTPVPTETVPVTSATKLPATATPLPIATATTVPVATMPNCVAAPALTEGPYFVDERLERSDIRTDSTSGAAVEGTPLQLTIQVSQVGGNQCLALQGAMVDIWHCDAAGRYSDVGNTSGQTFLRGYQLSDANGYVTFTTIYPGWYSGRAVHIHFKVRTTNGEFTSQFFFDEAVTAQAYQQQPYASRGAADMPNSRDGIFRQSGGQLTLVPAANGDGYAALYHLGIAG